MLDDWGYLKWLVLWPLMSLLLVWFLCAVSRIPERVKLLYLFVVVARTGELYCRLSVLKSITSQKQETLGWFLRFLILCHRPFAPNFWKETTPKIVEVLPVARKYLDTEMLDQPIGKIAQHYANEISTTLTSKEPDWNLIAVFSGSLKGVDLLGSKALYNSYLASSASRTEKKFDPKAEQPTVDKEAANSDWLAMRNELAGMCISRLEAISFEIERRQELGGVWLHFVCAVTLVCANALIFSALLFSEEVRLGTMYRLIFWVKLAMYVLAGGLIAVAFRDFLLRLARILPR
jgi:hypothetical protein